MQASPPHTSGALLMRVVTVGMVYFHSAGDLFLVQYERTMKSCQAGLNVSHCA
jgi:hypothetical protein